MTEIHKYNGDVRSMVSDNESVGNWENLKEELFSDKKEDEKEDDSETDKYSINRKS